MKLFLYFIKENWKLILEVVLLLFSVVMFIIKKKPVKVVDTLKEIIVRTLPALIVLAENQDGLKGADKLKFVLDELMKVLTVYGYSGDVLTQYLPFAAEQVEIILSTPQKKGDLHV